MFVAQKDIIPYDAQEACAQKMNIHACMHTYIHIAHAYLFVKVIFCGVSKIWLGMYVCVCARAHTCVGFVALKQNKIKLIHSS